MTNALKSNAFNPNVADLPNLLGIYIITYNRVENLINTVKVLMDSPVGACDIVVLDNLSTDSTVERFHQIFGGNSSLKIQTNRCNMGASANALQAFVKSNKPFTWILCDDDSYRFESFVQIAEIMKKKSADIIFVGGGSAKSLLEKNISGIPKDIIKSGFNYYKRASFLPGAIYSTSFALENIYFCYRLCYFEYPQMGLAISAMKKNKTVFVASETIVIPVIGNQGYSSANQLDWWFGISQQLGSKNAIAEFLLSQWMGEEIDSTGLSGLMIRTYRSGRFGLTLDLILIFRWRIIRSLGRIFYHQFRRFWLIKRFLATFSGSVAR